MITEEVFDSIKEGEIFATGYTIDSPEGANMSNSGRVLQWVAEKGYGNDFAVYCEKAGWGTHDRIAQSGQKINDIHNLKKLLSCSDEVWKKYRY